MNQPMKHILRSWLVREKRDGRVLVQVQVQCERCGRVAREPLRLPLALNETHRYVMAAKEQLDEKCV